MLNNVGQFRDSDQRKTYCMKWSRDATNILHYIHLINVGSNCNGVRVTWKNSHFCKPKKEIFSSSLILRRALIPNESWYLVDIHLHLLLASNFTILLKSFDAAQLFFFYFISGEILLRQKDPFTEDACRHRFILLMQEAHISGRHHRRLYLDQQFPLISFHWSSAGCSLFPLQQK